MDADLPVCPPETSADDIERQQKARVLDTICSLCGKVYDTYDSPMLKPEIWELVSNEHFDEDGNWVTQQICKECMEKKLGREIVEEDLNLDTDGLHVLWNERYIKEHFPIHKIQLFTERHAKAIEEYEKALGIK